jgi:hypothetical protein
MTAAQADCAPADCEPHMEARQVVHALETPGGWQAPASPPASSIEESNAGPSDEASMPGLPEPPLLLELHARWVAERTRRIANLRMRTSREDTKPCFMEPRAPGLSHESSSVIPL